MPSKSRLGEYDKAVQTLQQGLREGVWWSREGLLADSDLFPLHKRDDFNEVLVEGERRRLEAQLNSKPGLTVHTPPRSQEEDACPLIIALHGRGSNDIDFATEWKSVLAKSIVLAVPRSSQLMSAGTFCWDDLVKSEQEVVEAYSHVKGLYSINAGKIMLGGFSQGAALALYLALKNVVPCVGFIAVAPSFSVSPKGREEWPSLLRSGGGKGLRGCLCIGDQDPRFQKMQIMHSEMVNRGLQCQFAIERGMSHQYPGDFQSKLATAIDFILG